VLTAGFCRGTGLELLRVGRNGANAYPLHNRYNPLRLVPVTKGFLHSTRYAPVTTRYTLVDTVGTNFSVWDLAFFRSQSRSLVKHLHQLQEIQQVSVAILIAMCC
jgi:hypothetical protein